jgi:hypothetical protein
VINPDSPDPYLDRAMVPAFTDIGASIGKLGKAI